MTDSASPAPAAATATATATATARARARRWPAGFQQARSRPADNQTTDETEQDDTMGRTPVHGNDAMVRR